MRFHAEQFLPVWGTNWTKIDKIEDEYQNFKHLPIRNYFVNAWMAMQALMDVSLISLGNPSARI